MLATARTRLDMYVRPDFSCYWMLSIVSADIKYPPCVALPRFVPCSFFFMPKVHELFVTVTPFFCFFPREQECSHCCRLSFDTATDVRGSIPDAMPNVCRAHSLCHLAWGESISWVRCGYDRFLMQFRWIYLCYFLHHFHHNCTTVWGVVKKVLLTVFWEFPLHCLGSIRQRPKPKCLQSAEWEYSAECQLFCKLQKSRIQNSTGIGDRMS